MGEQPSDCAGHTKDLGMAVWIAVLGFALVAVAAGVPIRIGRKALHVQEQATFSDDQPIQHAVPLVPEVLGELFQRDEVKEGLDLANDAQRRDPARLFRAAVIHLHTIDESDLVVIGLPPMSGEDDDWFWIVRSFQRNPEVVLFVGASSLQFMASSTKGYRDVRTVWLGASETSTNIYKFNGKMYRLWKTKWVKKQPLERP